MLLIRPYPQPSDSLPNYLLRLTAANGYKNSMQLLRSADCKLLNNRLPSKKIFFGEFDLERVAMLTNISITQVEDLKFKQINNTRCLAFEQQFLVKSLNVSHVRLCPYCYDEHKTITFINSLAAKTYCTKHNCALITVHPVTGKNLTWATHYLWRDAASWSNKVSPVEVGEAEFQINQQIERLENNRTIIGQQALSLAEYCDLLEFFAHFHQFAFESTFNNRAKSDLEFSRQYYSAACWYIKEWPMRFFELLAHFEKHPMSEKRLTGIRKCFRDLYDDIYSPENSRSGTYKLLKSGFEEYLRDHFSTGMLMSSLTQVDYHVRAKSTYVTETQIAALLCCHLTKVKIYVRESLLSVSHTLPNGTRLFLRTEVSRLQVRLSNCCSIDECAVLLGISVYHTRQLLRSDIIRSLLKPNTENRDWLIERLEIEKLISLLKVRVTPSILNSKNTKKRFAFAGNNLAELIQKMLSNEVKYGYIASKNKPLSLGQFTPTFESYDDTSDDFLTPPEVCSTLGINKNAVYDFIKVGLLVCTKQNVKRTARPIKLIPKISISQFKKKYLLRHQLNGTSLNSFEIISGPKINGGLINVYRRTL